MRHYEVAIFEIVRIYANIMFTELKPYYKYSKETCKNHVFNNRQYNCKNFIQNKFFSFFDHIVIFLVW